MVELEKAKTTTKTAREKADAELSTLKGEKAKYDAELGRRKDQKELYNTATTNAANAKKTYDDATTAVSEWVTAKALVKAKVDTAGKVTEELKAFKQLKQADLDAVANWRVAEAEALAYKELTKTAKTAMTTAYDNVVL